MIAAILLAAGASRRMGSPKALLKIHETTFIHRCVNVLHTSGIEKIIVVLGADAGRITHALAGAQVIIALNEQYQTGQLSSVIAGLRVAESFSPDAILLHPVDHPLISKTVTASIIQRFKQNGSSIIVPTFNGRRGHPVLFSSKLFEEIKNAPPDVGARSVVWSHASEVVEIETDDGGILFNVDTPEDYKRLLVRLSGM